MSDPVVMAQLAWGSSLPDWVSRLAEECSASSQAHAAKQIKRSGALVNQVLKNKYPGDLKAVEEAVKGVFMNGTLICPALGEIPLNACQDWRKKSRRFANSNALRVRMFRACRACKNNRMGG